jgi:hypothetical protein
MEAETGLRCQVGKYYVEEKWIPNKLGVLSRNFSDEPRVTLFLPLASKGLDVTYSIHGASFVVGTSRRQVPFQINNSLWLLMDTRGQGR